MIRAWIKQVLEQEQKHLQELNYIFCSDTYLHKLNVQYLNHDTYTDIITFDNAESEDNIEGDVFISIERVKENAELLQTPFDKELQRVMIHGVLHLCSYQDKSKAEKERMREKEDACLSLLPG